MRFLVMFVLTACFLVAELVVGVAIDSLALQVFSFQLSTYSIR
jgi:Co/Zn/Cd efflux system component